MTDDFHIEIDPDYNRRLKEKITSQAKRLTKLEVEKEELLELLKEKNISSDNSFTSTLLTTHKKTHSQTVSKAVIPKKNFTPKSSYSIESKYKRELMLANAKINELRKSNCDMLSFKDNISQRLTQTTIDVEMTKKSLCELQTERDDLSEKVIELEQVLIKYQNKDKKREESIASLEVIIKTLRKEKNEQMNQIRNYEASTVKAQKETKELSRMKEQYEASLNDVAALKRSIEKYDKDLKSVNDKSTKLYQDNKDLANHLSALTSNYNKTQKDNEELKKINLGFSETIEAITKQLSEFQSKVEKDINETLRQSMTTELEQKKREFAKVISVKEKEIEKLKELTTHYNLLETELTNSLKQKEDMYNKLKDRYDGLLDKYRKYKGEHQHHDDEFQKIINESKAYREEIEAQRILSGQSEKVTVGAKNHIYQLKANNKALEERVVVLEKNQNYYEYLIAKTLPNAEAVREVIELYREIIGLEQQRRMLEKEVIDMGNEEYYNKTIGNIDMKINHLKNNLNLMENDLVVK